MSYDAGFIATSVAETDACVPLACRARDASERTLRVAGRRALHVLQSHDSAVTVPGTGEHRGELMACVERDILVLFCGVSMYDFSELSYCVHISKIGHAPAELRVCNGARCGAGHVHEAMTG